MEVENKTDSLAAQAEICQQLGLVNGKNLFCALDLHDDLVIDDEIHSVSALHASALVLDRQFDFTLVPDALKVQLTAEAGCVGGFQEPRAENLVDFNRCADDAVGAWVTLEF